MATLLHFPPHSPVTCFEITEAQAEAAQAALFEVLASCPACTGRGWFHHKHPVTGLLAFTPCPCGGTDADRIELDEVC